jgi:hypothetical protein
MSGKAKVARRVLKWIGLAFLAAVIWMGYRARQISQAVQSGSNLRVLSGSLLAYANNHAGHYPDHLGDLFIDDPTLRPELFVVPWGLATPVIGSTPKERAERLQYGHCSYVYLGAGRTEKDLANEDVLMFEADGLSPTGGIYCLYGDGHGEVDTAADAIQSIIATVTRANHPATIPTTLP